mmetsp:Transcript_13934/g.24222  ORF Transcript_13934/g.24222 Transcript_13934/m.24222 type:complete len:205 (+) Transcript_13934:36-650(+)
MDGEEPALYRALQPAAEVKIMGWIHAHVHSLCLEEISNLSQQFIYPMNRGSGNHHDEGNRELTKQVAEKLDYYISLPKEKKYLAIQEVAKKFHFQFQKGKAQKLNDGKAQKLNNGNVEYSVQGVSEGGKDEACKSIRKLITDKFRYEHRAKKIYQIVEFVYEKAKSPPQNFTSKQKVYYPLMHEDNYGQNCCYPRYFYTQILSV